MQYQQILAKVNGNYSLYSVQQVAAEKGYYCSICGRQIHKKRIAYYTNSHLQLCSDCLKKTRQPNKHRIPRI